MYVFATMTYRRRHVVFFVASSPGIRSEHSDGCSLYSSKSLYFASTNFQLTSIQGQGTECYYNTYNRHGVGDRQSGNQIPNQ